MLLKRRGRRHDLERRPRFVDVLDGAIAPVPAIDSFGKPNDFSKSASLRGAREIVFTGQGVYDPILRTGHLGILNSPQTWQATLDFLTPRDEAKDEDN